MIVHPSAEAEQDIEAIGDYIAADHPARAISFVSELRANAGNSPNCGTPSRW
jgi:plasmid stabilization system protein ParE